MKPLLAQNVAEYAKPSGVFKNTKETIMVKIVTRYVLVKHVEKNSNMPET